ncbi:DUF3397 domain-containing protein [Bacillus sp. C11]|nr:DUF3397 domain-containing protein [Neobacillus terrae]
MVMLPLAAYLLIFIGYKWLTGSHRKSVQMAADGSTIFFVTSVYFIIYTIWGKSLFLMILLVILIIGAFFVITHWKVKGEIHFAKVFKGAWRFIFLIFALAYFVLIVLGMIYRVIEYTC